MKGANYTLIGFGVGILLLLALYFFWHIPEVDKSYKRGLEQCTKEIDTVYIPGKDSVEYRDTTIYIEKPVLVFESDTTLTLKTENQNTFLSGKDTITTKTEVSININRTDGEWDLSNVDAKWFETIDHKDFIQTPDTIKIIVPKYIEIIETKTNWLVSGITYIAGAISAIAIFIVAK